MSLGERWLRLGWENNCSRYKNTPLILVPCGLHKFPYGPAYFLLTGSACYSCLPGSLCFFLLAIWIAFVLTCGHGRCEVSGQGVGRWGERGPLCEPKNKMLKRYWGKKGTESVTLPHLCCCFSWEVSPFPSTWLAWGGGSERAPTFLPTLHKQCRHRDSCRM